jgi:hypothetical protein
MGNGASTVLLFGRFLGVVAEIRSRIGEGDKDFFDHTPKRCEGNTGNSVR